ncbi:MAG: hypothetical protein UT55_C0048G0016 [Candidatus Peregrinibacteria bacterium GW2011_GWE2_39_6]|nr:MAG: hypothetical protein UT55_C0048G0016 [Candidatus Peregrinibacteria bacterium GW2011_GWE2_39_6]
MAADGLALYFESYNFATLLNQQLAASADGMFSLKSLLGGEQFDFSKFWGRGYALAVHQDTSFLPALTLLFDVRGDETMAQQFLTNIDQKLAGLIGLFQLQGGALANAFTKEEEILNGVSFKSIQLDLDTIMTAYGKNGLFQLPDQLKGQKIKLFYGITKEHHLLISTYEGWLEEEGVNYLLDDEMYKQSLASIKGFRSGLFYVAFDSLGKILDNWEMMRKAFQSAEVITKEKDAAGIPEKEDLSFSEWVSSLQSAIFSSDLGWYEVKSGGMVLLGK